MSEYKLPCAVCGQSVIVSTRQAGESVSCDCGKPLEVPTMRELRQLDPVPAQSAASKPTWTAAQGLLFAAGALMTVIAAGSALWLTSLLRRVDTRQPDVGEVEFQYDIETFSLSQTWDMWKQYSLLDIEDRPTPYHVLNRGYAANLRRWLLVNAVIGGIGVAAIVGAVIFWPRARRIAS